MSQGQELLFGRGQPQKVSVIRLPPSRGGETQASEDKHGSRGDRQQKPAEAPAGEAEQTPPGCVRAHTRVFPKGKAGWARGSFNILLQILSRLRPSEMPELKTLRATIRRET